MLQEKKNIVHFYILVREKLCVYERERERIVCNSNIGKRKSDAPAQEKVCYVC